MFGLGLYIYAGEDLPEAENATITEKEVETLKALCKRKGIEGNSYRGKKFESLSGAEYAAAIRELEAKEDASNN